MSQLLFASSFIVLIRVCLMVSKNEMANTKCRDLQSVLPMIHCFGLEFQFLFFLKTLRNAWPCGIYEKIIRENQLFRKKPKLSFRLWNAFENFWSLLWPIVYEVITLQLTFDRNTSEMRMITMTLLHCIIDWLHLTIHVIQ